MSLNPVRTFRWVQHSLSCQQQQGSNGCNVINPKRFHHRKHLEDIFFHPAHFQSRTLLCWEVEGEVGEAEGVQPSFCLFQCSLQYLKLIRWQRNAEEKACCCLVHEQSQAVLSYVTKTLCLLSPPYYKKHLVFCQCFKSALLSLGPHLPGQNFSN